MARTRASCGERFLAWAAGGETCFTPTSHDCSDCATSRASPSIFCCSESDMPTGVKQMSDVREGCWVGGAHRSSSSNPGSRCCRWSFFSSSVFRWIRSISSASPWQSSTQGGVGPVRRTPASRSPRPSGLSLPARRGLSARSVGVNAEPPRARAWRPPPPISAVWMRRARGPMKGSARGFRVGGADAPGRGTISPAAGQTAVRTALTLGSARGRGWAVGRGQALPRSDCASPRAEPPSRRRPRSPASLSPCRLPSCCHPCGGRITRLPTRARPAPRASLPPALTSSP